MTGFIAAKPPAIPLEPSEPLARYLLRSDWFSLTGNYVKPAAFMPRKHPVTLRLETSTYRIKGVDESAIWEFGLKHVAQLSGKALYGRGDVTVAAVRGVGLETDPNDVPPGHVELIGWPDEKSEQKSLAQDLAKLAQLVVSPPHTSS